MRIFAVHLLAATLSIPLLPAQHMGSINENAPQVVQRVKFAGGSALGIDYRSIAWADGAFMRLLADAERGPEARKGLNRRAKRFPLGTARVTGAVTIGDQEVKRGTYSLFFTIDKKLRWSLVLLGKEETRLSWRLPLEAGASHSSRLQIVLAAGEKDEQAVLRIAFGGRTCRLPVAGAPNPAATEAARVASAAIEVKRIYEAVQIYMVRNPGRIPSWKDLITPDARGHKYVGLDEPKKDPWGNEYVITSHPQFKTKPLVVSWGPDGQEGTEDDITPASTKSGRVDDHGK